MSDPRREPFGGKFYGIWDVEGDGEPVALFLTPEAAERERARRCALPEDDDDHWSEFYQVFRADIIGAWWNSYDPDPREDDPLTVPEILAAQDGDV